MTEKGFGKRTDFNSFNPKHRAGQGVIGISLSPEKGQVVASRSVGDDDEVFMIASNGVIIRMKVNSISTQGRSATGVKLMSVENDSTVTAIAPVIQDEDPIKSEKQIHYENSSLKGATTLSCFVTYTTNNDEY